MSVSELLRARQELDAANARVISAAKAALKEVLTAAFANPDIQEISWGQKSSEYNDEGMYPGVHGPYISGDEDEVDSVYDHPAYEELLGYRGNTINDPQFREEEQHVKTVLDAIGPEVLVDMLGSDEYIVIAYRNGDGYSLTEEYAGV